MVMGVMWIVSVVFEVGIRIGGMIFCFFVFEL